MSISLVILETMGQDPQIAELTRILGNTPYGACKSHFSGGIEQYYAATIILGDDIALIDSSFAIETATKWLEKRQLVLQQLNARKIVEIQSALDPEQGSDFLTMPFEFLTALFNAGCEFRHQYGRRLSAQELSNRLRGGEQ